MNHLVSEVPDTFKCVSNLDGSLGLQLWFITMSGDDHWGINHQLDNINTATHW